jgi:hypothetical protein
MSAVESTSSVLKVERSSAGSTAFDSFFSPYAFRADYHRPSAGKISTDSANTKGITGMFKHSWISMFAGFLVFVPVHAQEPGTETIADVRCIVVGMKIGASGNSTQKSVAMMTTLYYIGRIDGREPKLDIEDILVMVFVKMTAPQFASEATRCGTHLTEKGKEISKIGKDMAELGQKMLDKSNQPTNN